MLAQGDENPLYFLYFVRIGKKVLSKLLSAFLDIELLRRQIMLKKLAR